MFAVCAAVVFFLMAIGVKLGSLGMLWLALMFLSLHLVWAGWLPMSIVRRNPQ